MKVSSITIKGAESLICNLNLQQIEVNNFDFSDDILTEAILDPSSTIIFNYGNSLNIAPIEVAQCLRSLYPESRIIFVTEERSVFDKTNLIKNGFDSIFLLPLDAYRIIDYLNQANLISMHPELADYSEIQALDLRAGTILPFNTKIYLSLNNKCLVFSRDDEVITQEKIVALKAHSRNTLLVHKDELPKFYNYSAEQLKKIGPGMSVTERKIKLETTVQELVSDIFTANVHEQTFTKSKQLISNFQEIIRQTIDDTSRSSFDKIKLMMSSKQDLYSHLISVSVYNTLFGMAIGLDNISDLALSGLLHDLGKTNFPKEMYGRDIEELTPSTLEVYKQHMVYSIDLCKMRRIVLTEKASKAILQHHERIDGQGYPMGLIGERITKEAKVLAISDRFYHLIQEYAGKSHLTPVMALDKMISDNSSNPSDVELDKDLIIKIKEVVTGGQE